MHFGLAWAKKAGGERGRPSTSFEQQSVGYKWLCRRPLEPESAEASRSEEGTGKCQEAEEANGTKWNSTKPRNRICGPVIPSLGFATLEGKSDLAGL